MAIGGGGGRRGMPDGGATAVDVSSTVRLRGDLCGAPDDMVEALDVLTRVWIVVDLAKSVIGGGAWGCVVRTDHVLCRACCKRRKALV